MRAAVVVHNSCRVRVLCFVAAPILICFSNSHLSSLHHLPLSSFKF